MPEEIKQDVVLKTQKTLGKYVKKPPLNEKLLKKPPFRFLHDIVKTVIKDTGFLDGLFSEDELNSENVKEKDAKIAFLTKLIEAVKTITKSDLAVRPSKIVAGLEPTETNLLLQTIGRAIDKKLDSSDYVTQLKSGQIINTNEKDKKRVSKKSTVDIKEEKLKIKTSKTSVNNKDNKEEKNKTTTRIKEKPTPNETPKSTDRTQSKRSSSKETRNKTDNEKSKNKEKVKSKDKTKENKPKTTTEDKPADKTENLIVQENENKQSENKAEENKDSGISEIPTTDSLILSNNDIQSTVEDSVITASQVTTPVTVDNEVVKKRVPSAMRPKSARPKSGDLKERQPEEPKEVASPESSNNIESSQIQSRPKTTLRPPSVRPSSARPGAPRLRPDSAIPMKEVVSMGKINVIVENADKDPDDEEETVVIQQSNPELEDSADKITDLPGDNKGHLVEQILEQINESDGDKAKTKVDIDWQTDGIQGKDATNKEVNNLKTLIQMLTKTANPLGKLLNYLHEDIDAMHAELESWSNTKKQLFTDIAKQKKISTEMNKPLLSQLSNLKQDIKKIDGEILDTRSNILRNDQRIKELLAK